MNHVNTKTNVLKTHPANTASYLSLRLGVTQVASTVPFREEGKKKRPHAGHSNSIVLFGGFFSDSVGINIVHASID